MLFMVSCNPGKQAAKHELSGKKAYRQIQMTDAGADAQHTKGQKLGVELHRPYS
jgi:hypothetical protein